KSLDIDWSTGWLMADDTIIEKPYAKKIECVYWQYSSKNNGFVEGISLTILAWSDGKRTILIQFIVYEVEYAKNLDIIPNSICFDSKYSSKSLLNKLHSFNWI
ncbi:MAG: hypothetical protein V2B14_00060, partial [bacterium]